ncbi:MAG: 50S ribosomal protein L9 [Candidatus Krumholzibacteriota bacterium]|nr:50S ribosomal protein L9 [Candidatus Krumholzibacteriota bacterium]
MEILLIRDVKDLGRRGDVVNVAKGHYRNYLGPQGFAVLATAGNKRRVDEELRVHGLRDRKNADAARGLASRLAGTVLTIAAQAGEEGRLYGSVNVAAIVKELEGKGLPVEARMIRLAEPIKQLGEYDVELALHGEVTAAIKVNVVQE